MGNHNSHISVLTIVSLGFVAFAMTLVFQPRVPAGSESAPCSSSSVGSAAIAGMPTGGMIIGENPMAGLDSHEAVGGSADSGQPVVHAMPNGGYLMLPKGTLTHYMVATSETGGEPASAIKTSCRRDAALIVK